MTASTRQVMQPYSRRSHAWSLQHSWPVQALFPHAVLHVCCHKVADLTAGSTAIADAQRILSYVLLPQTAVFEHQLPATMQAATFCQKAWPLPIPGVTCSNSIHFGSPSCATLWRNLQVIWQGGWRMAQSRSWGESTVRYFQQSSPAELVKSPRPTRFQLSRQLGTCNWQCISAGMRHLALKEQAGHLTDLIAACHCSWLLIS